MQYDYVSKNSGKDLIYKNRLKIAQKLNIDKRKSSKICAYITAAELGIILI